MINKSILTLHSFMLVLKSQVIQIIWNSHIAKPIILSGFIGHIDNLTVFFTMSFVFNNMKVSNGFLGTVFENCWETIFVHLTKDFLELWIVVLGAVLTEVAAVFEVWVFISEVELTQIHIHVFAWSLKLNDSWRFIEFKIFVFSQTFSNRCHIIRINEAMDFKLSYVFLKFKNLIWKCHILCNEISSFFLLLLDLPNQILNHGVISFELSVLCTINLHCLFAFFNQINVNIFDILKLVNDRF